MNRICETEHVVAVVPLAEEFLGALVAGREADAPWVVVGPSLAEFEALCNKARLLETAAAAGIPSPASAVVTSAGPQRSAAAAAVVRQGRVRRRRGPGYRETCQGDGR